MMRESRTVGLLALALKSTKSDLLSSILGGVSLSGMPETESLDILQQIEDQCWRLFAPPNE